jgi:SAM-dependent methyltransferase
MKKNEGFFDRHPDYYDLMIPWDKRLTREIPLLEKVLKEHHATTILDIGCGTGNHAIALAQKGYTVTGLDNSPAMMEYVREKNKGLRLPLSFMLGDFKTLSKTVKTSYSAVIGLGNALAILPDEKSLQKTFKEIYKVLQPGGVLFFQVLNYQRMVATGQYDYSPRSFTKDDLHFFTLRHFHIEKKRVQIIFTLLYGKEHDWKQEYHIHEQFFATKTCMLNSLKSAGFKGIKIYGDMECHEFIADQSTDIIVLCHR